LRKAFVILLIGLNQLDNMLTAFEVKRAAKLIRDIVGKLDLELKGLSVLTEAGSNYFIFTPLIAYYAGSKKVYVWIKDTSYGPAKDIRLEFERIIGVLNIEPAFFEFALNERPQEHIQGAEIITNLGFVRPLDKAFLSALNDKAVVSYMCEAWELRPGDVDLPFCKEHNIKIAGVWENHPDLMIFKGCGALSVKLCMEAGLEVYQNNILVISSDKFGKTAAEAFLSAGAADVQVIEPKLSGKIDFSPFDIVFIADYSFQEEILGAGTGHGVNGLSHCAVVHLCGAVDYKYLQQKGIYCYPAQQGFHSRMTRTLAHLGLKPVIDLHAAGMKVGELLYKNEQNELIQPL
jgi:hypothetical protein